jgi:hypothetical protein
MAATIIASVIMPKTSRHSRAKISVEAIRFPLHFDQESGSEQERKYSIRIFSISVTSGVRTDTDRTSQIYVGLGAGLQRDDRPPPIVSGY